jgi:phospholipase C
MLERISNWVVLMFENRSFDSLLGHLPHIAAEGGIRDREIVLRYPGGEVPVHPASSFCDPDPDPGEGYGNVNVQLWGEYLPAANAGKSPYPLFPDPMQPPYNVPSATGVPTMDGFAVDYYANFCWEKGRAPTEAEMRAIGGMFTPETAPVINRLAAEFAVFTRWFCEVPSCTFPNRSFYHGGTSLGKIDNESVVSYAWDQEMPNLFGLLTAKGIDWRVYFDTSQIVPDCAINLAGLRHVGMWRSHSAPRPQFFADAAAGRLPAYSWLEPNMLFPPLDDYHPPTDIRAGEQFLARVFQAVRDSPQWPQTALIVLFDEHGGCYDHVPPSAAPVPDDHPGEQGFGFDRFGLRVPALVVSPYTERGTVIDQDFHTCSVLRTLRERFDLGPALSRRDAAAPLLLPAFNRSAPRDDRIDLTVTAYHYQPPNGQQRAAARGDAPDAWLLADKWAKVDAGELSQLAWWTLRNAARLFGDDPGKVPATPAAAQQWLARRLPAAWGQVARR